MFENVLYEASPFQSVPMQGISCSGTTPRTNCYNTWTTRKSCRLFSESYFICQGKPKVPFVFTPFCLFVYLYCLKISFFHKCWKQFA